MRRLRAGERLAGAGAAALFVVLFVPWFDLGVRTRVVERAGRLLLPELHRSGWSALGWPVAALLLIATAIDRPVAQQVAACVLTATAGTLATVVVALRVLVFQPGDNATKTLRPGAWLGLIAVLLIAGGGWWAIKDERTDAHESAYTPPPPRPAPPARS